ncbi:MAG TPA: DUF4019 domain-containing protein [Pyrinomonadaceae bacterium]|nr:DUF4019 domain-containing protein [Pyrinomonadaceae bacterium]
MIVPRIVSISLTILLVLQVFAAGQAVTQDEIRLTTAEAPWVMVIEGNGLDIKTVKVKPGGAYFLLYPNKHELNISLFIEPVEKCRTSDECRDFVLNAGNPAWGKFQGVTKAKIGPFSYFEFYRPEVQGQPLKMQDMYAEYVADGYWVDLHLSKVLYKKEDRSLFEKLVNSVRFVPKTGASVNNERSFEPIVKSAENWLVNWDATKCGESYSSLTSISKSAVTGQLWTEYCESVHKGLGKLKSRKLIATAYTSSLPTKPDHPGASLRYQSVFDNGPVIEFVSLTREKDGTWTVSNYRPQ